MRLDVRPVKRHPPHLHESWAACGEWFSGLESGFDGEWTGRGICFRAEGFVGANQWAGA